MKRHTLLFSLSLLLLSYHSAVLASVPALVYPQHLGGPQTLVFSIDHVDIEGISTASTERQVRQQLGDPLRVEVDYWECCGDIRELYYDATTIKLVDDGGSRAPTVFSMVTSDPDLATREGIRIGDSQQAILEAYGEPSSIQQDDGITTLFYSLDLYAVHLSFQMQQGQVIKMGYFAELT